MVIPPRIYGVELVKRCDFSGFAFRRFSVNHLNKVFHSFSRLCSPLLKSMLPVDTGRKLNVHKTFRRRPERLLNFLYTFNLCPVSMGFMTRHHFASKFLKEISIIIISISCLNFHASHCTKNEIFCLTKI